MRYKKFRADQLFDGYKMRTGDWVLITTEDGTVENIVRPEEAGDDIAEHKGILSPGLINCHCHLELSHMKGAIPAGTGLVSFVSQVIHNRHSPEKDILTAIEAAEDEMLQNGIVAVGDICNNTLSIPQKLNRRIHYHNFIEVSGFDPFMAIQRFQRAVAIFEAYATHFATSSSIAPHAAYSVSDDLWDLIVQFPNNKLLTIHNQESVAEDEFFVSKHGEMLSLYSNLGIDISHFQPSGKSALQSYHKKFRDHQQVIFVHNVNTTAADLLALEMNASKVCWCLCPNANIYIGGKLPDITLLSGQQRNIVLGTDSLASNNQLDLLAEMRTLRRYYPSIASEQMLSWATMNGAKALQMDKILGSFDAGKQPGVVLIKNDLSSLRRIV